MQTFLPYANFKASARILDRARLGKQRVETLQLMKVLAGETSAWANHPAAKMWQGYSCKLMEYQFAICNEWIRRGYKDTCFDKTWAIHIEMAEHDLQGGGPLVPPWLNTRAFHEAHRSNLLRKNPEWYGHWPRFDNIPDDLLYIWPGKE